MPKPMTDKEIIQAVIKEKEGKAKQECYKEALKQSK